MTDVRCKDYDPRPYEPPPARCGGGPGGADEHYPPCPLAGDPGRIGLEPLVGPMPHDLKVFLAGVLLTASLIAFAFIWVDHFAWALWLVSR